MFRRFERLVETYPDAKPATPPRTFFAFLWQSSAGLRPYILLMTLCTAVIGAFEAMLFAMLGQLVDWLANVEPSQLWATQRQNFLLLIGVLVALVGTKALQTVQSKVFHVLPFGALSATSLSDVCIGILISGLFMLYFGMC